MVVNSFLLDFFEKICYNVFTEQDWRDYGIFMGAKKTKKTMDARQLSFLKLYLTPGTKYFSNAFQSAMKAGFAREYAEVILGKDLKWLSDGLSEIVGKDTDVDNLRKKARAVLCRSLDSEDESIAQNTAKFIAEKTDKDFNKKEQPTVSVVVPIYGGKSLKGEEKSGV